MTDLFDLLDQSMRYDDQRSELPVAPPRKPALADEEALSHLENVLNAMPERLDDQRSKPELLELPASGSGSARKDKSPALPRKQASPPDAPPKSPSALRRLLGPSEPKKGGVSPRAARKSEPPESASEPAAAAPLASSPTAPQPTKPTTPPTLRRVFASESPTSPHAPRVRSKLSQSLANLGTSLGNMTPKLGRRRTAATVQTNASSGPTTPVASSATFDPDSMFQLLEKTSVRLDSQRSTPRSSQASTPKSAAPAYEPEHMFDLLDRASARFDNQRASLPRTSSTSQLSPPRSMNRLTSSDSDLPLPTGSSGSSPRVATPPSATGSLGMYGIRGSIENLEAEDTRDDALNDLTAAAANGGGDHDVNDR